MRKTLKIFVGFFGLALTVLASHNVSAASLSTYGIDNAEIKQSSTLYAISQCYTNGQIREQAFTGPDTPGAWRVVNDTYASYPYPVLDISGAPNGLVDRSNCSALISSFGSPLIPPSSETDAKKIDDFLKGMGYKAQKQSNTSTNGARVCATYNFTNSNSSSLYSAKLCQENGGYSVSYGGSACLSENECVPPVMFNVMDGEITISWDKGEKNFGNTNDFVVGYWSKVDEPSCYSDFDQLALCVYSQIYEGGKDGYFTKGWSFQANASNKPIIATEGDLNDDDIYMLDDNPAAINKMIKYLSSGKIDSINRLKMSWSEKIGLMRYYLEEYYGYEYYDGSKGAACNVTDQSKIDLIAASGDYDLLEFTNKTSCWIRPGTKNSGGVHAFNSDDYPDGTEMSLDDVLNYLRGHIPAGDSWEPSENPTSSSTEDGPTNSDQPMCYEAAKTLGWILCPVIEGIGTATRGLYQAFIEPFLNISSDFLKTGNSVEEGWRIIRSFANTLFAIAFVIVILAQVTGIGISNYNIKKILPRLIMVVVLVNLSFIICQLAVDVSNILGSGLYTTFIDLAGGVKSAGEPYGLGGIITTLLGTLGIAGAGAIGFVIARETWELWLIPFLLALVGCIIGALFFFIVLAVRQAGIIVLIVLAPVAIVCYALPNTKSFFDRWRKMLTSLLLVYPICGVLLGGGLYVSKLLTNSGGSNNVFFMLAGMLVQVVPFFMIPSIVRSSMTALGNLGNKITGFGQRLGGRATGAMSRSRFVQDRQQELTRQNTLARDRRIATNNQDIINALSAREKAGTITDRERRRLRAAEYRLGRSRGRIEKSATEDALNSFNANREILDVNPDNQRYNAMISRLQEQATKQDAEDWATRFDAGGYELGDSSDRTYGKFTVNTADLDSLSLAHEYLLNKLMQDPNDSQTLAQVRAIQNKLAKQKDLGFERMHQNYLHLQAQAQGDAAKEGSIRNGGLSRAAGHLMNEYAGDLKSYGGKGMMLSFQDMQGNKFSGMGSIRNIGANTAIGSRNYYASDFVGNDPSSLKESNFNDLSNEWFSRTTEAIRSGDMTAEQAQQLATVANSYLHNDNVEKKTGVVSKVNSLLDALYGSSNMPTTSAGMPPIGPTQAGAHQTIGSQSIISSPSTAAATITADLKSAGQWSSMSAEQQQRYANMIGNVQYALDHGTFNQADARQLQDVLRIAHTNGYGDASTTKSGVDISGLQMDATGNIKVNDLKNVTFYPNSGGPRHIDLPPTWSRRASDGVWIDTASGKKLKGEDLTRANAIEQHNINADINNNN